MDAPLSTHQLINSFVDPFFPSGPGHGEAMLREAAPSRGHPWPAACPGGMTRANARAEDQPGGLGDVETGVAIGVPQNPWSRKMP